MTEIMDNEGVAYAKRGKRRRMTAADDVPSDTPEDFTPLSDPPAPALGLPAPWDGKAIILAGPDGERQAGYWRWTRYFSQGAWLTKGVWAQHLTAGIPLTFAPVAWRVADGWAV